MMQLGQQRVCAGCEIEAWCLQGSYPTSVGPHANPSQVTWEGRLDIGKTESHPTELTVCLPRIPSTPPLIKVKQ